MQLKRVVITGLGAITPLRNKIEEFWKGLVNGVSGADKITRFDASKFKTKFACEVKNYDPATYFDRKELKKLDLFTQFAIIASDEAVKDANFDLTTTNLDRVGVIWASGIGGIGAFLQEVKGYALGDGTPRFSPFFIPKMISDVAGCHSMKYGFGEPNFTTVSACASSTNALMDAFIYVRMGKADIFISGGFEAAINEAGMAGFNAMQAVSTNNEEYKTASRPFDATRDGFVMSDGGALLVEEYDHDIKSGAKIYVEIVGGGMSADAYQLTSPHPEGTGATLLMSNTLEDASMKPEEIDFINVHGTSTPLGDIAETKAIKNLFGDYSYRLNIRATKSMTGHFLGAAGAIEAMVAILAVKNDIIPPSINFKVEDPEIDKKLYFTFNKFQPRIVRAAISNTFGFSGHNISVTFKKFSE